LTGFKVRAIPQDDNPVEGQARFRAIPVDELININGGEVYRARDARLGGDVG
jgi:hypothetical protein